MEYALFVPMPHAVVNTGQLEVSARGGRTPLPEGEPDPGFLIARDMTVAADRAGFYAALVAQRLLGPDLEAWVLASAIAPFTSRIRMMPALHTGLWHPVLAAKMLASLDRVAPGRSAVNLVTGWYTREYEMFGGRERATETEKYREAVEWVEIIRELHATGRCTYKGEVLTVPDGELPIAPGGSPPPLFTATRSAEGHEMVARVGDWWFVPHGRGDFRQGVDENARAFEETLATVRDNIQRMDELAGAHGRKVRYAVNAFAVVGDTDADGVERARWLASLTDKDDERIGAIQISGMTAGLVGSADTVRARIAAFADLGVELVLLKLLPDVAEMHMLTEVLGLAPQTLS